MALDKAIQSGKEHRKPYRRSKAFDRSCRNHGGCGWCEDNRTYQARKEAERIVYEQTEQTQEYHFEQEHRASYRF